MTALVDTRQKMTSKQLTNSRSILLSIGNPQHLAFLASFSLLPIFIFTRFRWNTRFGLDPRHLILIQLLFTLFFHQKLSSSSSSSPSSDASSQSPAKGQQDGKLDTEPDDDKPERKKGIATSDTPIGIAKALQEIIEKPKDWMNTFSSPGLEIYQHRTMSSLYTVRTEIEEGNVTLEQLVRCIRDSKQWEWDRMCECGEDLGDGVTWLRLKGFWPIKPKELIIRSGIFRLPPSKSSPTSTTQDQLDSYQSPVRILAASSSTLHPLKQATLQIKFAGYLVEQIHASSNAFQVTQIVDLSGFGPLPTFVTKAILRKFMPSSLKKLIGLAHQIQPDSMSSEQAGTAASWMPPLLQDSTTSHSSSSPSSKQDSEDQASLRPIVDELKRVINELRHQNQQNEKQKQNGVGKRSHGDILIRLMKSTLKFTSLLGSSSFLLICIASLFLKSFRPLAWFKLRNSVRRAFPPLKSLAS